MQYMLLLNETESEFAQRNHPEHAQTYWGGWNAFIGAMAQAGVIVKALNGDRDHLAGGVIGPGAADFLGLEGIVLGTVAVDGFDMAAALFGPQAVGLDLPGEQGGE